MLGHLTGAAFAAFASLLSSEASKDKPQKGIYVDSENQVWIVDEKGNKKKLIDVANEHGYFNPVESAGGRYAVSGLSGNLYVADPNGGDPVDLGTASNPTWSPDGRHLIFERTTDDGHTILSSELWYANADGSGMMQLTTTEGNEGWPAWSPDGMSIAYIVDGVLYIAPIEP